MNGNRATVVTFETRLTSAVRGSLALSPQNLSVGSDPV